MAKTPWAMLALVAGTVSPVFAGPSVTVETVNVLRGTRGEEVALLTLKPMSDGNAIIRITGTGSPVDGLALPYKRKPASSGNGDSYITTWHGRELSLLYCDHRHGDRWELYFPGSLNQSRSISVDAEKSKALAPKEVVKLYESQQKDGTLTKSAAFNRAEEQAAIDKSLGELIASADQACGGHIAAQIVWSTVKDEDIKRYSLSGYCGAPLSAMETLCKQSPAIGPALLAKVKSLTCSWGSPLGFAVDGGKLAWSLQADSSNLDDFAKAKLEAIELSPPSAPAAAAPAITPWGDGHTVGQRIALGNTNVCSDGKKHYVVSLAHHATGAKLYYGDGKSFGAVTVADLLGPTSFFEPRFVDPKSNPSFRGADARLFSAVNISADKGSCELVCGTRKVPLQLLPAATAAPLLLAGSYTPEPDLRLPHRLNRDDNGTYYYVDKGGKPETANNFRLFVGAKGNLKPQKMTNVVSDSQGEIFSTKTGELRFIAGANGTESAWVKGKSRQKLLDVPINENLSMIHNDLGVYAGQKRGTPCDDL